MSVSRESRRAATLAEGARDEGGAKWTAHLTIALFLLALAARALGQGQFVTVDEAYHWFDRARAFRDALLRGDFAGTILIGHPGVTTMWLGAAGEHAYNWLASAGWLARGAATERLLMRLPVAVATALCVALAYPLLLRLVSRRVALLGALLWAGDPFLVAHAQLLHLDALLASFMALSLLALLVATMGGRRAGAAPSPRLSWPWLVASGVAAGLALLTKSPSLFLLPVAGLILLARSWRLWRSPLALLGATLPPLALWAGVALITWAALWPAVWVDPRGAAGAMIGQIVGEGGQPHAWGNFFMGRAVDDPGPLFYPVAVAMRLTPWATVGLVAAALLLWRAPAGARPLLALALFALAFLAAMSALPKKFDRYMLPIFPALDVLAAAGLLWLLDRARRPRARRGAVGKWAAVVAVLGANLAWYHPYALAYYNPLLGGGMVAARVLPVGWGEGYEQVGALISTLPPGRTGAVATWYDVALQPFLKGRTTSMSAALRPGEADYAVLYIDQIQRNNEPEAIAALRSNLTPVATVRIHGITYASIYALPPPVSNPLVADFEPSLRLRGYDVDTSSVRSDGYLTLTLSWELLRPITDDLVLFGHALDATGARVGQADVPLAATAGQMSSRPGTYFESIQRIAIPADTPPGDYWMIVGLYHAEDGTRLHLTAPPRPGLPGDGENALVLGTFRIDA